MKICVCQFVTEPVTQKIHHLDNVIDFNIASVSHWNEGTLISDGNGTMYKRSKLFEELNSIHGWEKHP